MSFLELLLVVIVALLVLGPERLTELVVKMARVSRRTKMIYAGIKQQISEEIEQNSKRDGPADPESDRTLSDNANSTQQVRSGR